MVTGHKCLANGPTSGRSYAIQPVPARGDQPQAAKEVGTASPPTGFIGPSAGLTPERPPQPGSPDCGSLNGQSGTACAESQSPVERAVSSGVVHPLLTRQATTFVFISSLRLAAGLPLLGRRPAVTGRCGSYKSADRVVCLLLLFLARRLRSSLPNTFLCVLSLETVFGRRPGRESNASIRSTACSAPSPAR